MLGRLQAAAGPYGGVEAAAPAQSAPSGIDGVQLPLPVHRGPPGVDLLIPVVAARNESGLIVVTGSQRQRLVGRQVVGLIGLFQTLAHQAVHPLRVARAGRQQVHQQQMHADVQRVHRLGTESLDDPRAILVGRR